MGGALCVLQAADLRLDEPIAPVSGLPTPLRDIAIQARQLAAAELFQQALNVEADLLLLTGPLAEFSREPRLACWLGERFGELGRAGTLVVCANAAPADLLIADQFPANVRILSPQQSIAFPLARRSQAVEIHWNRGQTLIERSSRSCDLVLALHTQADGVDVEYFSRGAGDSSRQPDFPLQRSKAQLGSSSGLWKVTCPAGERPRAELIPVASVAWQTLEQEIADGDINDLRAVLRERFLAIKRLASAPLTVVNVQLSGDAAACEALLNVDVLEELLTGLRDAALTTCPRGVWCSDVELMPPASAFAAWSEAAPVSIGLAEYDRVLREDVARDTPQAWKPHSTWISDIGRRRAMRDLKLRVVSELQADS